MKNYSKKEAIAIITQSAARYAEYMENRQYLIAYADNGKVSFSIIGFRASNFKHFTGVETSLSANTFYQRALERKLGEDDFRLDKKGKAQQKLAVLPNLHRLFYDTSIRGMFNRSGILIEIDYFVGAMKQRMALGCRRDQKYDVPVSLYCEDVRKLTLDYQKILATWVRKFGDQDFKNIFCIPGMSAADMMELYVNGENAADEAPDVVSESDTREETV